MRSSIANLYKMRDSVIIFGTALWAPHRCFVMTGVLLLSGRLEPRGSGERHIIQ